MPAPLVVAGIAIAALGLISDFVGGSKAAKAAKRAAKGEAAAELKVTQERIRQLDIEERVLRGQTIAAAAGGGVKTTVGSPMELVAEQAKEFAFERKITAEVGASRAAAGLQRGRDVGSAYKYQSYSNLAKGASNIFSMMSQSGMFSKGQSTTSGFTDLYSVKGS